MVFYASTPARRARQIVADAFVLVWIYAAVRAGQAVHEATLRLAAPGRQLEQAGRDLGSNLAGAADQVGNLPIVGDGVRGALDQASTSAGALVTSGRDLQTAVGKLAVLLGVLIAVVPILVLLLVWLPRRARFVRRASAAKRFVDADPDLDLFALRAMAHQPMHVLARISDDPAGAWRRGDPAVVRQLARLELHSIGLQLPAEAGPAPRARLTTAD